MRHFIILLFSFLFLISCRDKLIEKPKAISEENFYNTPEEVQTAVNGIFAPLKDYNCFGFLYPAQLVCYSDFAEGRGSYEPVSQFQGLNNTNIGRISLIWSDFYQAIRNANNVIKNLVNNQNIAPSSKNQYLAEAQFMRAFVYFHIIRNWGKAVLRTEKNMLDENVPLSSSEDVYKFIEDDLTFSEANLPDKTNDPGYPTSGAAKTLLADVYFYQGKYQEALNLAKEVINSGEYSLVKINTYQDFEDKLYGPDLITSPEEIFYLKFSRLPGDQSWSYVGFLHSSKSGYYGSSGALWAIYIDTLKYNVYSNWDNRDIRKQLWYGFLGDFGLGPNKLLSRKFIDPETIQSGTQAGNDYPFYRYADLLLLFAESECHVNGVTVDAVEALNQVKRRGYGQDPLTSSDIDYHINDFQNNREMFIDTVIAERGYEDFVEGGKRWLDLKRLGKEKAREIIKEHTGKGIADKHFLWPFPADEINTNKGIKPADQNPGY
jgi:tetratricopeptide (TPR) repeat protein